MDSIYIKAANQVSIQQPLSEQWMTEPVGYDVPYARAIDPAFRDYIPPLEARRMGKVLKRALVTSLKTLADSGVAQPDAIITGTGLGCIENTELFLDQLCREGETLLKPTVFMQSTHNTISSLLAIHTKTHGYNVTYSHRGSSFDAALLDAFTQLRLGAIGNALVGAHDETTPTCYALMQRVGYAGGEGQDVAGEASVAMLLAGVEAGLTGEETGLCRLASMRIVHDADEDTLASTLQTVLDEGGLALADIDAVVTSANGNDARSLCLCGRLAAGKPLLRYKNIFGECFSSSAFAVYAAAHCIARGMVPSAMRCGADTDSCITPRNLLLVLGDGCGKSVSLILLRPI